nr:DUF2744 domain-containing protein [Corynebacterium sp. TAE3-ERU2]
MQSDCDPTDPAQAAAWAIQFIPRPVGEPVMIQPQFTPFFSQLLHDLGFRHHPELQVKKQTTDGRGWVDIDDSEGGDDDGTG